MYIAGEGPRNPPFTPLGGPAEDFLSVMTLGISNLIVGADDPKLAGTNLNTTSDGSGTTITMADFVSKNGNCKPRNKPAMDHVKNLQMQLNRVAKVKGFPTISADGDVGKGTLALMYKVQTAIALDTGAHQIMGDTTNCLFIAGDADVLAQQVQTYANTLKAPLPTPTEIAKSRAAGTMAVRPKPTPSNPNPVDLNVKPKGASASLTDVFKAMSTPQKVIFGGLMGGIAFLVVKRIRKRATP